LLIKKSAKSAAHPVIRTRLGDTKPPSNIKCIVPAFYGNKFGGKDGGLCTHNPPAKEVGLLGVFLYAMAQNFEL
jgi:hypothetical protein